MYQAEERCREYEKIYDVVQTCGQERSPKSFVTGVVSSMQKLCPYDEALAYFFDGNGKIYNQFLVNIDDSWSTMYLEY